MIGPRIKRYKLTATVAGGAGAATVSQTIPTGYKFRSFSLAVQSLDPAATISLKDNNGAGSEILTGTAGWTVGTDAAVSGIVTKNLGSALTTPLKLVVAGGGNNGNTCYIDVVLYRTRGH